MDNTTLYLLIGAAVIIVGIVSVIVSAQQKGHTRRTGTTFVKPSGREPVLPPGPPVDPSLQAPKWNPHGGTPVPEWSPQSQRVQPVPVWEPHPVSPPADGPDPSAPSVHILTKPVVMRLRQEVEKLRESEYQLVTLGYKAGAKEKYCIQVRVSVNQRNVSIHVVCTGDYPLEPPKLVVTTESDSFDDYGQLLEQQLHVTSPILERWDSNSSNVVAVVNETMMLLPGASPANSKPTPSFFDGYKFLS